MNNQKITKYVLMTLGIISSLPALAANPASTQYVNDAIRTALAGTVHHFLGQLGEGGTVFAVENNGLHGYVFGPTLPAAAYYPNASNSTDGASPCPHNTTNGGNTTNNPQQVQAYGSGLGGGYFNTLLIISAYNACYEVGGPDQLNYAAYVASTVNATYTGNTACSTSPGASVQDECVAGYYLPSADELQKIFYTVCTQGLALPSGVTAGTILWSSTVLPSTPSHTAAAVQFNGCGAESYTTVYTDNTNPITLMTNYYPVIPVRRF